MQKSKKIDFKKDILKISSNSGDNNINSENNFNYGNSFQKEEPNNILNLKNFGKSKMNSNKNLLIANNSFAPNIYIQTPIINIDKKFTKKGKFLLLKKNINNSKKLKRLQILSKKNNINKNENKGVIAKLSQAYYDIQ